MATDAQLDSLVTCDELLGDQPCGRPAIAIRSEDDGNYPVCITHVRNDLDGAMVSLGRVVAAWRKTDG